MHSPESLDELEREAETYRKTTKTELRVEILRDGWSDELYAWTITLDDEPATLADDIYGIVRDYAKMHGLLPVDHDK